jgi:hypothetical protein
MLKLRGCDGLQMGMFEQVSIGRMSSRCARGDSSHRQLQNHRNKTGKKTVRKAL